jgi:sulfoxide reductase heme-binding subunit YedZ
METRTKKPNRNLLPRLLRIATHVGALFPLASILWDYWFYQLSADPIREITLRTGGSALILLALSLACTPLNIVFGWKQLIPLRRPLGLYAFFYASLHGLTFVWLDYGLDLGLIRDAIFQKPFALAGLATFLLLLPLALTSNRWFRRKLGQRWVQLHRLAYLAGITAGIHFLWLVKNAYTRPLLYGALLSVLLLMRAPPVRDRLERWRTRLKRRVLERSTSDA